jgi:hypothetical protein
MLETRLVFPTTMTSSLPQNGQFFNLPISLTHRERDAPVPSAALFAFDLRVREGSICSDFDAEPAAAFTRLQLRRYLFYFFTGH